jgi:hypothetical protein
MEIIDQFSFVHFKSNKEWQPLPVWARFFLSLGESFANTNVGEKRYTAALALPTRSYATALIGSGFSHANLLFRSYEDSEYIKFIHSLPEGTSVKFFDNGKVKKAIKKNLQDYNGILLVGIQIEGGTTQYIRPENVHKIEVTDKSYNHLPNRQKGRTIMPPSQLLNALMSDKAYDYVYQTRIEGVVVGSKNILQQESILPLAILSKNTKQEFQGNLNDIFRVEGFNPSNAGHRFLMHTSSNNDPITMSLDNPFPNSVVIFDGALGFVKWKEMYKTQNWVVVLDHTDSNFSDAVSQINSEYAYRSESTIKKTLPLLPNGVEMMFFERDI